MNIVQLHHKTLFYNDSQLSPRFKKAQVDDAINSAINTIILDRYDNIKKAEKDYSFQTSQRLRDELSSLVKQPAADIAAVTGVLPRTSFPTDYSLLLSCKILISGTTWINAIPLTYDELNIVEQDPFRRPSIEYPQRIYRIEREDGLEIIIGEIGEVTQGKIWYLATPTIVTLGTEVASGSHVFAPAVLIAYTAVTLFLYNITGYI